jgi:hypothetical protein
MTVHAGSRQHFAASRPVIDPAIYSDGHVLGQVAIWSDWRGTARYEVLRCIGRGAMGVVYEYDRELKQPVDHSHRDEPREGSLSTVLQPRDRRSERRGDPVPVLLNARRVSPPAALL